MTEWDYRLVKRKTFLLGRAEKIVSLRDYKLK